LIANRPLGIQLSAVPIAHADEGLALRTGEIGVNRLSVTPKQITPGKGGATRHNLTANGRANRRRLHRWITSGISVSCLSRSVTTHPRAELRAGVTRCAGKKDALASKSEVLIFNTPRLCAKGNLNGEQDNAPTDRESIE
ncbi:MAG TPA: hypothetical protein VGG94_04645, partial [Chthoniobacterales bacterium]